MIALPSIDKSERGEGSWGSGPAVYIDPSQVVSIEPRQHSYHSFRPKQDYCTITLSTGTQVDVMLTAQDVFGRLQQIDPGKAAVQSA